MLSHHSSHVNHTSGRQQEDTGSDFAIAYTFLSLFLLVLSFFVVLTVLSEVVEEKVQQALSSVAEVFSPISVESKIRSNPLDLRAAGFTKDFILDEIEILVETDVHVAETTRADRDGSLEVRVKNKALFQKDKAVLKPEMNILLKRISATIASGGQPIHASFVTSYSTSDRYIFAPPLSVRRAGELGRIALQEGISPQRVQSGLDTDLDDETVFRFQVGINTFPSVRYIPNPENPINQEQLPEQGVLIESGTAGAAGTTEKAGTAATTEKAGTAATTEIPKDNENTENKAQEQN